MLNDIVHGVRASFSKQTFHPQMRDHIETTTFSSCPWKFCVAASRLPCDSVPSHAGADPHTIKNFPNHTRRFIFLMLPLLRSREARRTRPGPAGPSSFPIRRRKAPRKISAEPDSSFPYARAQHGGTVRLRTLLSPRTGIRSIPSPEPGSEAGQFLRGGFLIYAALLLRRSSPERRDCARPFRKRAGAAPQSRSRRGGLPRLAVCTVPACLSLRRQRRICAERELQTERQDAPPTGPFSPGRQLLPLLLSILLWRRRKVATMESHS